LRENLSQINIPTLELQLGCLKNYEGPLLGDFRKIWVAEKSGFPYHIPKLQAFLPMENQGLLSAHWVWAFEFFKFNPVQFRREVGNIETAPFLLKGGFGDEPTAISGFHHKGGSESVPGEHGFFLRASPSEIHDG
jgi:hypothetical protein